MYRQIVFLGLVVEADEASEECRQPPRLCSGEGGGGPGGRERMHPAHHGGIQWEYGMCHAVFLNSSNLSSYMRSEGWYKYYYVKKY